MRKRAQSAIIDTTFDLDFTVLTYECHDATVHKALGLNIKECQWKVQCRDSPPLDIKVLCDKNMIGRTEVNVTCNGAKIFPMGPSSEKSRLLEDFVQTWPFRGQAKGINELHFVEVQLFGQWFPGTVLKQRTDGFFEVMVSKPGVGGFWQDESYPFINKRDLREAATKQPYTAPEVQLVLKVPASDPLHGTTLTASTTEGRVGEDITRYFGRPTPHQKGKASAPKILFQVNRDRTQVTGNIGHRELLAYWNGEARAVEVNTTAAGKIVGYGKKAWKVMVGMCQHTIEVERQHRTSKHITLTVDGAVLIEALAEDIGCQDGVWATSFRFVGEPVLEFEVYETDTNGYPLATQGRVEQKRPYNRQCVVQVQDMSNLAKTNLFIDGVEFKEMDLFQQAHAQGSITIAPTAMTAQYQITVPYKVNRETAPANGGLFGHGIFGLSNGIRGQQASDFGNAQPYGGYRDDSGGLLGIFSWCCGPPNPTISAEFGSRQDWPQEYTPGLQNQNNMVQVNNQYS
jgi:hypothetical protein